MNYNEQYNINNISTNIHNKLFDKYLNYLELNKNNKNIKLKGNYKYNNMPISYYLNNPNFPITNNNLTPLPINKKNNNNIKNNNIKKNNNNMQKNIISMRRMEYNYKLKKNNNNYNFNYNNNNINKEINSYKISLIILIQRQCRKRFKNKKKNACLIQATFRGYIMHKYYQIYKKNKNLLEQFIFKLNKIFFLNLYFLKIKVAINKHHFIIKKKHSLIQIKFIQNHIKHFLITKNSRQIFYKSKCVFIKPINNLNLGAIKLIQKTVINYLLRLQKRKKRLKSIFIIKFNRPISKILLIQKFIRAIYRKKIKNNIPKNSFNSNYFFNKINLSKNNIIERENLQLKLKNIIPINTKITPFRKYNFPFKIQQTKNIFYTKTYCKIYKIKFLQKFIRKYLTIVQNEYSFIEYPKKQEFYTKVNFVFLNNSKLLLLQKEIKYFLYRQNVKKYTKKKITLEPMIYTKTIRQYNELIFQRLSKLRIEYDKELIIFIVRVIENTRKFCGRLWFYKIKNNKKRKLKLIITKSKNDYEDLNDIDPLKFIKSHNKNYKFNLDFIKNKNISNNKKNENINNNIQNDIKINNNKKFFRQKTVSPNLNKINFNEYKNIKDDSKSFRNKKKSSTYSSNQPFSNKIVKNFTSVMSKFLNNSSNKKNNLNSLKYTYSKISEAENSKLENSSSNNNNLENKSINNNNNNKIFTSSFSNSDNKIKELDSNDDNNNDNNNNNFNLNKKNTIFDFSLDNSNFEEDFKPKKINRVESPKNIKNFSNKKDKLNNIYENIINYKRNKNSSLPKYNSYSINKNLLRDTFYDQNNLY